MRGWATVHFGYRTIVSRSSRSFKATAIIILQPGMQQYYNKYLVIIGFHSL